MIYYNLFLKMHVCVWVYICISFVCKSPWESEKVLDPWNFRSCNLPCGWGAGIAHRPSVRAVGALTDDCLSAAQKWQSLPLELRVNRAWKAVLVLCSLSSVRRKCTGLRDSALLPFQRTQAELSGPHCMHVPAAGVQHLLPASTVSTHLWHMYVWQMHIHT